MKRFYKIEDDFAIINLSSNIYPIVSIQKAIINFIEKVYIVLEEFEQNTIVKIKLKNKEDNLDEIIGEFYNEILRESLRYNISKETKNLRELIVGRALYTACIETENNQEVLEESEINVLESVEEDYPLDEIAANWFDENDDIKC